MIIVPNYERECDLKLEYMNFVCDAHTHGYNSVRRFRSLVGARGIDWQAQDIVAAPGWSLKAMAVYVLLEHLHEEEPAAEPPVGLRYVPRIRSDGDMVNSVLMIARRWRSIEPNSEFWNYVNHVERQVSKMLKRLWPEPTTGVLVQICDVFAAIYRTQLLWEVCLVPCAIVDAPPARDAVQTWVDEEIESHKRMMSGAMPPEIIKLYMSLIIQPGEEDEHARTEGGVFASNDRDVLESQRPNIAAEGLWEACQNFDTEGANGVLIFYLVERVTKQYCHLAWIENNLFVDQNISSEQLVVFQHRCQPYILCLYSTYYIIDPDKHKAYKTKSATDAIDRWFRCFYKRESTRFFDGDRFYDLADLPRTFPLSRH